MLPTSTTPDWGKADKAYAKGVEAYIELGQAFAELNSKGTTQEAIGVRYEMHEDSVRHAIAVGNDPRILELKRTNRPLPKSTRSLYLLTTLDDEDFDKLAKPDTTEAKILSYKRALAAPSRPIQPTPKEEYKEAVFTPGYSDGAYLGSVETPKVSVQTAKEILKSVFATFVEEAPQEAYRMLASKYHPDRNGSDQAVKIMAQLNQAKEILK